MKLTINGQEEILTTNNNPAPTVLDLITLKGLPTASVVVELDGDIVPREDWALAMLHDGAEVELLRFVGGG